jgi:hypothetical protein
MADDAGGFLSRWSRRKTLVRQGEVPAEPVQPQPLPPAAPVTAQPPAPADLPAADAQPLVAATPPPPPPTLADVATLGRDSDFTRFVAPGVDSTVKNAALKKLFSDPHFNVMDGLDTYIDDYGRPDPLPAGMLRQMAQSHALGLFSDEPAVTAPPTLDAQAQPAAAPLPVDPPVSTAQARPDEDAALRLQPHDAAGPPGADGSAGPHAG